MKKMILIILLIWTSVADYAPGSGDTITPAEKIEKWLQGIDLTEGHLKFAMQYCGVKHADIVYGQACLETGNFTSELCNTYNNLFGMRLARIRQTTALGATPNNYASYRSWYDSVKDVALFQQWYQEKGRDLTDYIKFLASIGYAEDPIYLNKLSVLCSLQ